MRTAALVGCLVVLGALYSPALPAQEETHESGQEHRNAVVLFLGGVTRPDPDGGPGVTGTAVGMEYSRRLRERLSIATGFEWAFNDAGREFVLAAPLFLHVTETLFVLAGPGLESFREEVGGELEREFEFLARVGAGYDIEVGRWRIVPQAHADLVGGHWTYVYGAAFGPIF
jgi:hypothetical protein